MAARAAERSVHPWAWWAWASAAALTVSMTTNPLFCALIAAAVVAVVLTRRSDAPWARSLWLWLALGGSIVVMRLVFQAVMGVSASGQVLFLLPEIPLPAWAMGIRLGGPVTAEGLWYALQQSLRLAVMLLCLGAANALANPRRALRSVPAALHDVSVAVTIAVSLVPQLVSSVRRVRRARRLRGGTGRGWSAVRGVVIPVLADATDRSMALAASMEARGFGRTRAGRVSLGARVAMIAGAMLLTGGLFTLLAVTPRQDWLTWPLLAGGAAAVAWSLVAGHRQLSVTRHRPDRWGRTEWLLVAAGVAALACGLVVSRMDPAAVLIPSRVVWPPLHPLMPVAAAALAAAIIFTPPRETTDDHL